MNRVERWSMEVIEQAADLLGHDRPYQVGRRKLVHENRGIEEEAGVGYISRNRVRWLLTV